MLASSAWPTSTLPIHHFVPLLPPISALHRPHLPAWRTRCRLPRKSPLPRRMRPTSRPPRPRLSLRMRLRRQSANASRPMSAPKQTAHQCMCSRRTVFPQPATEIRMRNSLSSRHTAPAPSPGHPPGLFIHHSPSSISTSRCRGQRSPNLRASRSSVRLHPQALVTCLRLRVLGQRIGTKRATTSMTSATVCS